MGDFDWLTQDTQIRKKPSSQQAANASARPSSTAAAAAAAGGANAAAGVSGSSAAAGRVRIALPSFREVEAAQRPAAAPNIFQPGILRLQQQQQQQQQVPPHHQQQQQQPHNAGPGPPAPPPPPAAAAAPAAGGGGLNQADGPSGPSLGLNISIPRYNQSSTAPGQAAVGAVRAPPTAPQPGLPSSSSRGYQQQQQRMGAVQPGVDAVMVSNRQQGNPVLKHIKSVRWMFADIVPDYTCGANTGVIFLSLRYHLLQPEYVLHRLKAVQRAYRLTVLLLLVDVEEVVKPLQELHKAALGADATLICAFSNEECARYIETFKAYENRPASSIMERTDTDYLGRLTTALTTVRGINRTDAYSLASKFGSLAEVMQADLEDFAAIPGLGPVKARRLVDVFSQPFKKTLTAGGGGETRQQQQGGSQQVASPPQQQGQQQQRNDSGDQLLVGPDQDLIDDEGLEDWADDDQGLAEQGVEYEADGGGRDGPDAETDSQQIAAAGDSPGGVAAGAGSESRAENIDGSEDYQFYDDQDDGLLDEEF